MCRCHDDMKRMSALRYPAEDWDEALWEPMCAACQIDVSRGLDLRMFLEFDSIAR